MTRTKAGAEVTSRQAENRASRAHAALPCPLRVLHVIDVKTSNYYLNNLVDHTAKEDVEFSFVTFRPEGSFVDDLRRRGVTVYALNTTRRSSYFRTARELSRIIRQEKIDIVHTHLFDPTFIGLVTAKLRRRKVIVTRHHSDALYQLQGALKRRFYLAIEKFINGHADYFIAPSRMVRDILIEREGVSPQRVTVIPYGQTSERFEAVTPEVIAQVRKELGMAHQLVLVCNSRLYERKGHRYLFAALAPLVGAGLKTRLYLVGAGDYQTHLEELARSLGLQDHVRFLGWRDDALAIMAAADIIVHPSLEDALSSAVIESLMLERPIIATDISGVRDTLGDGEFGSIVPPADAESLRAALQDVIRNLSAAQERARRGRKHILEYMNAGRVAREYLACYQKLVGNGGRTQ